MLHNVRVTFFAPDSPTALDYLARERGESQLTAHPEWPKVLERIARRDWRKLRERLIRLNLDGSDNGCSEIAAWLNDAGYTPITRNQADVVDHHETTWKPAHVSSNIRAWIRSRRDVVSWLMRMDHPRFVRAIGAAWDLAGDEQACLKAYAEAAGRGKQPPRLKQPAAEFMRTLRAPRRLDLRALADFLLGVGYALSLSALFHWDRRGWPEVTARIGSPMEAIGLSVQIDRNFSSRRWVRCAQCGNGFERKKGSDRFCSSRCRNYFNTTHRRRTIRLLRAGEEAWKATTVGKRGKGGRVKWIASWIGAKDKGRYSS